jgi:hypothetical protein
MRRLILVIGLCLPGFARARAQEPVPDFDRQRAFYDRSIAPSADPVQVAEDRDLLERRRAAPKPPASDDAKSLPVEDIPGSDWKGVGKSTDAVGDAGPSSREKLDFWDQLHNGTIWYGALDQACKGAELPADYDFSIAGGILHAHPGFKRSLHAAPDGKLLLIDEASLNLSASHGVPLGEAFELPLSLGLGFQIVGGSMVIRPLKGVRACKELLELADLRKLKTVYPLHAGRFKEMAVGEIWLLPLTLTASIAPTATVPLPDGAAVSVSFGYSRSGGVNVSLRRLAEDRLRVRIRFDYASVTGPGITGSMTVPAAQFAKFKGLSDTAVEGALGRGLIGKEGAREAANLLHSLLNTYFTARISLLAQHVSEDHALFEVVLDPHQEESMKGLEELLSGGRLELAGALSKKFATAAKSLAHLEDFDETLPELQRRYERSLAEMDALEKFAGTDRLKRQTGSFSFGLPLLWDHSQSGEKREDLIRVLDDSKGELAVYREQKQWSNGYLGVPFAGDLITSKNSRSVTAFSYSDREGAASAPTLVFVKQHGFTHSSEYGARELLLTADSIMRLAGTRGRGDNEKASLPMDRIFPETPPRPPVRGRSESATLGPSYHRGLSSFTLVLSPAAVEQIVSAPQEDVIRAYARTLDDSKARAILARLADTPRGGGRLTSDEIWSAPEFPKHPFMSREEDRAAHDLEYQVKRAYQDARKLAKALRSIQEASDDRKKEAESLRNLVAGTGGLSYESMMRVLVQLCPADQVAAEAVVNASPSGSKVRVDGRYLLNPAVQDDPALKRLYKMANRFNPPVKYSD